jgi:protein dithiol:quinone oxidoreductase
MMKHILYRAGEIAHSRQYWMTYIICGFFMLSVAMYYQYVLEEPPCLICIQIRLWVSLFMIISFIGVLLRKYKVMNMIIHLLAVFTAIGLTERSYQLLGTERHFVFGDCGFNLGLPSWFAIEEWLPWLFRIDTTCGNTPELIFGITIAEALMVISVCAVLTSASVALAAILRINR